MLDVQNNKKTVKDILNLATSLPDDEMAVIADRLSSTAENVQEDELYEDETSDVEEVDDGIRVKNNMEEEYSYRVYLRDVGQYQILTPEQERDYAIKAANGSKYAKEMMTNCNLRLVLRLLKQFRDRGIPMMDLIQEGNFGLCKAVEMFDYKRGFRFSTYASWWILQRLRKATMNQGALIAIPTCMTLRIRKIAALCNDYFDAHGRYPTQEEIVELSGFSKKIIKTILNVPQCTDSLSSLVSDDSSSMLMDVVPNSEEDSVQDLVEQGLVADCVNQCVEELNNREKYILHLYYREHKSLQEIGNLLGITRERVRQIKNESVKVLRYNQQLREQTA